MDVLLGLDLGTTNCKALAFDLDGRLVGSASAPTPALPSTGSNPADRSIPLYDAEALWQVSARLMREVNQQLGSNQRVAALAVASMGESGVLADADGIPLAPVLNWYDRRTVPWNDWWRKRLDETTIYQITGLPLDHIYSAHKLLWHRQHDPTTFERAQTWLGLSDWIAFRLTGKRTTSYSMASRTMLFDLRTYTWSEELLRLADLPASLLPPALPSGEIIGQVTQEAARVTGLAAGTSVATGGHDHICAALAAGVTEPGTALNSSGTTDTVLGALKAPVLSEEVASSGLCCGCHTARGRYYLVGGFMSGAVVSWLTRLLGGNDGGPDAVAELMDEAASAPVLAKDTWFLPYLGGSGPPDRDPNAWGAWLGLRLNHSRGDLVRAAMEGLCFALRYLLEGHRRITGDPIRELRAVGGGTRNIWWQRLKADVLGLTIEVPDVSEVTARGAALLGGIAVGVYADEVEAAARAYRPARRFQPDAARHAIYDAAYRDVFLELYPTLRGLPLATAGKDYEG